MTQGRNNYRTLVARLSELIARARALGIWDEDRELLECPRCGLLEDVTFEGQRITCHPERLGKDTGLRFEELPRNRFRCPVCRSIVKPPDVPVAPSGGIQNGKRRRARSAAPIGKRASVRSRHLTSRGPRNVP